MGIKSAVIEEITQRIEHDLSTGLSERPSRVKRWFVNNIFRRTFAYMIAWTEANTPVLVKATTGGVLKFIPLPTVGFSDYESQSGTGTSAYAANTYDFSSTYYQIDILVEKFDLLMQFKKDDSTWGNDIVLTTGWHSLAFEQLGVRLKNRSGVLNGDYNFSVYK